MPRIKESIECWLLKRVGGRHHVVLLRVQQLEGQHPDFLQPVTGGIKPGESAEEACIREVLEETSLGLTVDDLRRLPETIDVVINDGLTVHKTLFHAEIDSDDIRINPNEHIGWKLSDVRDVEPELYWQSNKDTWAKVLACLQAAQ